jgi:hypothetical protein
MDFVLVGYSFSYPSFGYTFLEKSNIIFAHFILEEYSIYLIFASSTNNTRLGSHKGREY